MNEPELVGGVLFDADDPVVASRVLVELLTADRIDYARARSVGLEPVLVESLKRRLPPDDIDLACASGAGWVLGRRSAQPKETWEVVASLPAGGVSPPAGLRRTTAETMIGLASTAHQRIRLAAPYVDKQGLGFLVDSVAAATHRGVVVHVFDPIGWEPARAAIAHLRDAVQRSGVPSNLRLVRAHPDGPFSHLKVMIVDGTAAYVGSANVTGAGLAGRNLELGVLVRGSQVAVIEGLLDIYQVGSGG